MSSNNVRFLIIRYKVGHTNNYGFYEIPNGVNNGVVDSLTHHNNIGQANENVPIFVHCNSLEERDHLIGTLTTNNIDVVEVPALYIYKTGMYRNDKKPINVLNANGAEGDSSYIMSNIDVVIVPTNYQPSKTRQFESYTTPSTTYESLYVEWGEFLDVASIVPKFGILNNDIFRVVFDRATNTFYRNNLTIPEKQPGVVGFGRSKKSYKQKAKKQSPKYIKTSKVHTDKKGVSRSVYVKDGIKYVKKLCTSKDGTKHMKYYKI